MAPLSNRKVSCKPKRWLKLMCNFRYVLVGYTVCYFSDLQWDRIEISWASFDETLVECWFNAKNSNRDILRFRGFCLWYFDMIATLVVSVADLEVSDLPQTLPTRPWGYDKDGVSLGKKIRSSLVVVVSCVMSHRIHVCYIWCHLPSIYPLYVSINIPAPWILWMCSYHSCRNASKCWR